MTAKAEDAGATDTKAKVTDAKAEDAGETDAEAPEGRTRLIDASRLIQ